MQLNSDINVLGSLSDWSLLKLFFKKNITEVESSSGFRKYTHIKTDKSVKRFEKAITGTFLTFKYEKIRVIFECMIDNEAVDSDLLLFVFWNASINNELLNYLNKQVYFPAFFSGRIGIKTEEVIACLEELKTSEENLKKWSDSTIKTTASKYLTLLKKFGLMEGTINKTIIHPYLNDKMFILFIYWISIVSEKSNLFVSKWLEYNLSDKNIFIERILQKRFSKYINVVYTGDKLKIEPLIPYNEIYEALTKS